MRAFVFSPMNLYSHFVNSSSRIQVRYTRHRRRAFPMFLDFRNSLGVRNSLGGVSARSQGNSLGGVNSLGGGCFRIRKSTLWGGGYYHDNEITVITLYDIIMQKYIELPKDFFFGKQN